MRVLLLSCVVVAAGCGRSGTPPENGRPVSASSQPVFAPAPAAPVNEAPVGAPLTVGAPVGAPVTVGAPMGAPVSVDAPAAPAATPISEMTPQSLYAQCEGRLEQPQAAGECSSDADCVRAGCSSEICTTTKAAADLMTTCEVLPCFEVVDACGCVEGECRWSLVDVMPALNRIDLPQ